MTKHVGREELSSRVKEEKRKSTVRSTLPTRSADFQEREASRFGIGTVSQISNLHGRPRRTAFVLHAPHAPTLPAPALPTLPRSTRLSVFRFLPPPHIATGSQSRRDCITQPRVGAQRLPWVTPAENPSSPTGSQPRRSNPFRVNPTKRRPTQGSSFLATLG